MIKKFKVNANAVQVRKWSFVFEVEAESQEEANNKVENLGTYESLDTFPVLEEDNWDNYWVENYFEIT